MIDECVARNGAIDLQHATVHIGVAGVGVGSRQMSVPVPILVSEPPVPPTSTILNHPGKGSAKVVAAYGQIVGSEKSNTYFRHPSIEPIVTPGAL